MIINTVVGHVYALRSDKNELFEVLEDGEKPRLRSLRTGVHLRAKDLHRDHIYLGPMPKVGDTWLVGGPVEATVIHIEEEDKGAVGVVLKGPWGRCVGSIDAFLKKSVFVKSGLRPYQTAAINNVEELIKGGCLTDLKIVFATGAKDFLNTKSTGHRYLLVTDPRLVRNTIWQSRKKRFVKLVGLTDKVVHLRDALTDEYLGFRMHADFLRTYAQHLTIGATWYYGKVRGVIRGLEKHTVVFFDQCMQRNERIELKEFLTNSFIVTAQSRSVGKVRELGTAYSGWSSQAGSHLSSAFQPIRGDRWRHKETGAEIEIVSSSSCTVVKKKVGSRTSNTIRLSSLYKYYERVTPYDFTKLEQHVAKEIIKQDILAYCASDTQTLLTLGSVWVSIKSGKKRKIQALSSTRIEVQALENGKCFDVKRAEFRTRYTPFVVPEVAVGQVWKRGHEERTISRIKDTTVYFGSNMSLGGMTSTYRLTSEFELVKNKGVPIKPAFMQKAVKNLLQNNNFKISGEGVGRRTVLHMDSKEELLEFCKAVVQCQQST